MARAEYTFKLDEINQLIVIEDQNTGGMSVTNDIENVVEAIAEKANIDPLDYVVIYKDTNGLWDGWDPILERYIILGAKTLDAAVKIIA